MTKGGILRSQLKLIRSFPDTKHAQTFDFNQWQPSMYIKVFIKQGRFYSRLTVGQVSSRQSGRYPDLSYQRRWRSCPFNHQARREFDIFYSQPTSSFNLHSLELSQSQEQISRNAGNVASQSADQIFQRELRSRVTSTNLASQLRQWCQRVDSGKEVGTNIMLKVA